MPTPVNDSRCTWKEISDRGLRDDNQDRAISIAPTEADLIRRKGVLLVVCDGVGAELGGKRAAELAADATLDAYYENSSIDAEKSLQAAITSANFAVQTEANMRKLPNMATTIVAGVVNKGKLYLAHVGDSRAYLLRDGRLIRLTQDHTSMSDAITAGTLTREDTRKISKQRAITRSLGTPKNTADFATRDLRWGDRVLLCSDGLYDALDDSTIERTLKQQHGAERAVNALLKAAVSNNASDNVSVSVLNYGETAAAAGAGLPIQWIAAGIAALLVLVLGGFGLSRLLSGGVSEPATAAETNLPTAAPVVVTVTKPAPNPSTQNTNGVKPEQPTPTPEPVATAAAAVATADPAAVGPQPTATLAKPVTATPQPRTPTRSASASNPNASTTPAAPASFAGLVPNGLTVYVNDRFGIELISTGYERWGDPQASSLCDGYYDLRPVHQFKLTVRVVNTSDTPLSGLAPQFYTSSGTPIPACHDGGGPLPTVPTGESRVVRLLAYLHEDQDAATLTLSAQGRHERVCFVANKLARC